VRSRFRNFTRPKPAVIARPFAVRCHQLCFIGGTTWDASSVVADTLNSQWRRIRPWWHYLALVIDEISVVAAFSLHVFACGDVSSNLFRTVKCTRIATQERKALRDGRDQQGSRAYLPLWLFQIKQHNWIQWINKIGLMVKRKRGYAMLAGSISVG